MAPGFNIDASFVGNRGKLVDWTRDHRPDAHTVIDDYKQNYSLCRDLHDASPTTLLVHRHYHPGGENTTDYLRLLDFDGPEWLIYNIGNEPGLSGDDLIYTLDYLVAAAHLGASRNKPMCLGNFSTGSWRQSDIDDGIYDEYLKVLALYYDLHYSGLHQYKLVRLPYFFNNGRVPKDLVDPAKAGDEYDVTPDQFIRDSTTNYHLGRDLWFDKRCMQLGIRAPRKIFTEYLYDRNRDELEHVPEIDNFAERQVSGIDTVARYYQKMQPQRSWEQSVVHQIEHMENCFTNNVVGKCIYAWTLQSEWGAFDVSRHDNLLKLLPKGKPMSQQPQFPYADHDSRWESVDIYPLGDFANFRAGDTLNAEVYFEIRERMKVDVLHAGDFKPEDKVWIPFRITRDGQTYRGYIRSDVIGIDWLLEVPLPDNTLDIRIKLNNALLALNEMDEKLDFLRDQITRAVEGLN